MSETTDEIKQEILIHKESITELETKLKLEEQKETDKKKIFAIASKGKTMDPEALGLLSKKVFFWEDVIRFLADNEFITVDQVFHQPPTAIKRATMADILCLFVKDEPESKEGGK